MKHNRIVKLTSVIFFSAFMLNIGFAQQKDPLISFEEKLFDFKEINESDGIVKHRFWFINKGGAPLIINHVKTTCGCTTPKYSKAPVLPGERGYIDIGYNPKNRPGPFQKRLTVLSNAVNNSMNIEIKGMVKSRDLENIENPPSIDEIYKFKYGAIKINTNHLAFSRINYNESVTKGIKIYNPTDIPFRIKVEDPPEHIKADVFPDVLKPGEEGDIVITYDAQKKNDWGFVFDRLHLSLNGEKINGKNISVSANIIENFDNLTEDELAMAPVINFKIKSYDFDTIFQQTTVSYKFEFVNEGKSDLLIRRVKPSCGCTASHTNDNVIKPGQKSHIVAKFNTGNRKGKQSKTITIITNDPKNHSIVLRFTAVVIPENNEEQ